MSQARYLARYLDHVASQNGLMLTVVEPIIVVARRGKLLRVAGHRTYAVNRLLRGGSAEVPVLVTQRLSDELILALATFDVMGHRLLSSLGADGMHQIHDIALTLAPEFRHSKRGRPKADQTANVTFGGLPLTHKTFSTSRLAAICGVPPSTLRRPAKAYAAARTELERSA